MTENSHSEFVPGCFRCDLSRDEIEGATDRRTAMGDERTAMLHSVGVDYCLTHLGLRNEDEDWCAWREDRGNECETCEGLGFAEDGDAGGGTFDCADCGGDGFTPCDLRELVWVDDSSAGPA